MQTLHVLHTWRDRYTRHLLRPRTQSNSTYALTWQRRPSTLPCSTFSTGATNRLISKYVILNNLFELSWLTLIRSVLKSLTVLSLFVVDVTLCCVIVYCLIAVATVTLARSDRILIGIVSTANTRVRIMVVEKWLRLGRLRHLCLVLLWDLLRRHTARWGTLLEAQVEWNYMLLFMATCIVSIRIVHVL